MEAEQEQEQEQEQVSNGPASMLWQDTTIVTTSGIKTKMVKRANPTDNTARSKKARETREKRDARKTDKKGQRNTETYPPLRPRHRPPPVKETDYNELPGPPLMTPVDETAEDNNQLFRFSADYLRNRRNFWYMPCVPAPLMPSIVYSYTEVPPYGPRINWHDMSPAVLFDKDGLTVTTDKGFRMTRANVMLREGSWYFECKVLRGGGDQGGHVRVGLARREASQEGPVGADGYSYGLRDQEGQKVHLSRPRPFMNESFGTGDVIGIHVHLPTLASQYPDKKVPHPFRHDRYPIRWKGQLAFELPDYSASKAMDNLMDPVLNGKKAADPPTLPGSFIKVYKNGKPMGMAFENLFSFMPPNSTQNNKEESIDDGMLGYYPAVSVFRKGMVKFNFGPNFDASPEDGLLQDRKAKVRAVHERFDEQIAEDVTWDIVDEVIYSEYDATEETATGNAQANLKTKGIKTLLDD